MVPVFRRGRRIRVIPFDVVIPPEEQDGNLDEQLQLDADAILTWAVRGYHQYQSMGLAAPQGVLAATEEYRHDSDSVARFIGARCSVHQRAHATTSELHDAWLTWAENEGDEPISLKAFGKSLDAKGFPAGAGGRAGRQRFGLGLLDGKSEEQS